MTVVVNAVAAKMGGAATYLRAVVTELQARAAPHRFVFFVPASQAGLGERLPDSICWHPIRVGEGSWLRRLWWDQVTLRRRLREHRADVLLSFSDFGVFGCPVPQLLIFQNPLYFSELFQRHILPRKGWWFSLLYRLRRWLVCRSAALADRVLTPSASMLAMVRRAVPLSDGKATVNYFGAAAPAAPPMRNYDGPIRLLFPTYYADHKNFATALQALQLVRQRHGDRFRLVTTADPLWVLARLTGTWRRDLELLEELGEGAVEVVGLLPHERLLELYGQCHVMCYPTLAESFGFPLVEALACGLPVVASDIPVNRELARDAALYFDPFDAGQLAAGIEEIVTNADLRAALQQRGRRYAPEFSWARHTEELVRQLEELAASPARKR